MIKARDSRSLQGQQSPPVAETDEVRPTRPNFTAMEEFLKATDGMSTLPK